MDGREDEPITTLGAESVALPGRLLHWLEAAPRYPPNAGDLRTLNVLGLRLPVRATVAVVAVALILLLDYHGRIDALVTAVLGPFGAEGADAKRLQAIGRLVLEGVVPLLLILLVMRDRPSRYGLVIGDWRAGLAIAIGAAW